MQPPPRAEPGTLTWTALVWVARAPDGRQTADLVSLSQMSQAFRHGVLPPDVEVAIVGEWQWENIRLALARHATLAPPAGTDIRGTESESLPRLELTLTMQKDALGRSNPPSGERANSGRSIPIARTQAATVPPAPLGAAPEFLRRWGATPSLREVLDPSLETPLTARLASLVYGAALVLAALSWLAAIIIGVASLFSRLNEANEPRLVVLALLVGIGWVLGGVVVAGVVVIMGRAAAGIMLVAQRVDEKLREDGERRD